MPAPLLSNVIIPSYLGGKTADGADAPVTKWMNPMWDTYFQEIENATGTDSPVFTSRNNTLHKLPTSPGQSKKSDSRRLLPPSLLALGQI
jgi:hypothetical protein